MAGRRGPRAVTVVLVLVAVYLLYLAVPNIGPAVRAARADGVPGVFTAQQRECVQHPGHESCVWTGDFRSDDNSVRRTQVDLYGSERDSLRAGERTRAFDIGRDGRVYGPGGSNEWVIVALMILLSAGILTFTAIRGPIRRPRLANR
ncbi:hypothetical protein Misp01_09490 [Microtetraspora sp. NBRC 13810]|uniref:hypothetical protein n=1 Tax=Microtetraspora sp. NBRC 13810 TaxID=3030990 RepID=UPI0024A40F68|nr:hypothetical protein [Microtetraspora sp. NBRC 13810]GLW05819.1 hypothetical protein Misp01_09490 [Microtetraspora sp. NBRC 13810]